METLFLDLCQKHGLSNVGTMFQHEFDNHLTVYLHWGSRCVSGGGKTFEEALSNALTELAEERDEVARAAVEGAEAKPITQERAA